MNDDLLRALGFSVGIEGERRINDDATYLLAPELQEKVPNEFANLLLSPQLYFITTYACHGFYPQFPILRTYTPNLEKLDFHGKKVTIIQDHIKANKSLFDSSVREQLKTGSIEGDVAKLFEEHIVPRGGVPTGFIRIVHPDYEKENLNAGKLVGSLYNNRKLGPEVPLDQYIELIR